MDPLALGRSSLRGLTPWQLRSQPLAQRTGSQVFQLLYGQHLNQPPSLANLVALLESPYPLPDLAQPQLNHHSLCAGPPRWQGGRPRLWTPPLGEILPTLAARLAEATAPEIREDRTDPTTAPPFSGGWLGWLGYDLAWEIERLPTLKADGLPFPVALWYEPESFAVLDHTSQRLWLAASSPQGLDHLEQALQADPQTDLTDRPIHLPQPTTLHLDLSAAAYQAAVRQAQAHIRAGDVFQVNLSLRFSSQTSHPSWHLYRQLQAINPSPFACYWRTPWGDLISCSPERLVRLQGDRAETRPIAGTRPRGQTPAQDEYYRQSLLNHPKERAEHIMLVDLERNDLGRVCRWGTVEVTELLTVEHYSHVMHLVSNITGHLAQGQTAVDLIRAVFPGGTITGCPKVRCMEIIEQLEPVRRSLFYGSCGYLDRRGNLDLNILIRTLLYGHGQPLSPVWGQVGAGIVADSDPEREWLESLQKARAQLLALGLNLDQG